MESPDIEELRSFPALGPQGLAFCDINGRAYQNYLEQLQERD
jgi:hypothetical protein